MRFRNINLRQMTSTIHKLLLILCTLIIHFSISAQARAFEVSLINGVTLTAYKVEIIDKADINIQWLYLSLDNSQTIPIDQVSSFENEEGFHIVRTFPNDNPTIYKRILDGSISVYRSFQRNFQRPEVGGGLRYDHYSIYIFNEEIKLFDYKNLKKDLKEYPNLTTRLKKYKRKQIIRPTGYIASIGLIGLGLLQEDSNPFIIAGLIGFAATKVFIKKPEDRLLEIVDDFNKKRQIEQP